MANMATMATYGPEMYIGGHFIEDDEIEDAIITYLKRTTGYHINMIDACFDVITDKLLDAPGAPNSKYSQNHIVLEIADDLMKLIDTCVWMRLRRLML